MKIWLLVLSCIAVGSLFGCASAQAAPEPMRAPTATAIPQGNRPIYVIDPNNGAMTSNILIIDPDARRVVGGISARHTPEISFSPDGKKLYVADSYLSQVIRGEPHDVLTVYDTATGQLVHDDVDIRGRLLYKLFPNPQPYTFLSRDGKRLFVGKYGDPDIHDLRMTVLDAESFKTLAEFKSPPCYNLSSLLNGRLVCVQNSTVFIVDSMTGVTVASMAIPGTNVVAMVLAQSRDWLYLVSRDAGITVIDLTSSPRVVIRNPSLNLSSNAAIAFNHFALSKGEDRLYIGIESAEKQGQGLADEIWAFDTSNWNRVGIFKPSDPAFHIAISRDGTQLYAVNPFKKSLSIFDTSTFQEIGVMHDLGETPAQVVTPPP